MSLPPQPARMSSGLSYLDPRGDAVARPHGNTYWLWAGHILAGEHPALNESANLNERLKQFSASGITHFIDLTSPEDPLEPYLPLPGAIRISHHILDFGIPSHAQMKAILESIHWALNDGGQVYVHCRAGIGRTGTVAATWLVSQGLSGESALALLAQKWQAMDKHVAEASTPETLEQREWVLKWLAQDIAKEVPPPPNL